MTASPGSLDADVTIVGYGPTGKTLAILLAQRGHRVVVLERWPSAYPLPRAVHFDHEVGRILQSCGIGEALREASEPAAVYEWQNAAGTTLLRFGRLGAGASGWPESSMFHQPTLEDLLDVRVRELPLIEVRRGVEVDDITQTDGGVSVSGTDGSGQRVTVTSAYAVGCDGANSVVRRQLDVPVTDLGFFYDWLIVDVILSEPREFDPLNTQICNPARPTTAVSGGPGRRRWEFMRLPDETRDDLDSLATAWDLLAPWDVTPANATVERHAVYTFTASYADRWRDGRVLLAGDAAHQMPPFAGQGMCSGVRDSANLAWKLDVVLRGSATDALLNTYADERLPSARQAVDFSMALGHVICVLDDTEARVRDDAMSAMVTDALTEVPAMPPLVGGACHSSAPVAGELFPQGTIGFEGREALLDDCAGAGWRLLTIAPEDLDYDLVTWFESLGGRVLAVGRDVTDVDGTYVAWFAQHDVSWALQRPDFAVYGAATSAEDAAALLHDLRAQLGCPAPVEGAER